MKYYAHNVGDWLPATVDLTAAQEGMYRRLMDWYYSNEVPLPLTFKDINAIARSRNTGERDAVRAVVSRYFTLAEDGWHHPVIDKALETYSRGSCVREEKRVATNARQLRSRQKRDAAWAALISRGVPAPFKATISELEALLRKYGITQVVTRDEMRDEPRDYAGDRAITKNHEPNKTVTARAVTVARAGADEAGGSGVVIAMPPEPDRISAAIRTIKAAGFPLAQASTADPRFLAVLQAGLTDDQLRLAASEAVARSKSWGWLVAVCAGRLADIAAGYGPARPANARSRADHERVAALTPSIAKRAP